ncbi:MAG TPA: TonB-dependent receptor plug domain-containing protein, partial [Pseudobacter sp.]|nr:TonB-dependent receptor plug domain-containing protein [Pseudobacter sp.]
MPGSTHWRKQLTPLLCILVFPAWAFSQSRPLKGKVTDRENNTPLAGVSIQIKGKPGGASSDAEGNYSINVSSTDTITASFVGYIAFTTAVKDLQTLDIVLSPSGNTMADVVVVGYGTQKKGDLTGSLSSVNSKDIKSLPVTNAGDAIQGRAAGVQILSSGAPGSNATIRVRGTGTINNSDPLLVIDGVPTDVPLNTISPDDISSIEILKDASASAIYGSRGANGVVLISTKRGVSGKSSLEFKSFYGTQKATSMVDMLNASQFASMHNEMMSANGQAQNPAFANPPSLGNGTNWLDLLFRSAP